MKVRTISGTSNDEKKKGWDGVKKLKWTNYRMKRGATVVRTSCALQVGPDSFIVLRRFQLSGADQYSMRKLNIVLPMIVRWRVCKIIMVPGHPVWSSGSIHNADTGMHTPWRTRGLTDLSATLWFFLVLCFCRFNSFGNVHRSRSAQRSRSYRLHFSITSVRSIGKRRFTRSRFILLSVDRQNRTRLPERRPTQHYIPKFLLEVVKIFLSAH